jgi:hypothetical protein
VLVAFFETLLDDNGTHFATLGFKTTLSLIFHIFSPAAPALTDIYNFDILLHNKKWSLIHVRISLHFSATWESQHPLFLQVSVFVDGYCF